MSLLSPVHMAKARRRDSYITWCGTNSELLNRNHYSSFRRMKSFEAKSIHSWRTATCKACLEVFLTESRKNIFELEEKLKGLN